MSAAQTYLNAAREADLLATVRDLPYVAGVSTNPLSAERSLLVEYADPALLSTAEAARALWRALLTDHPDVPEVAVRAQAAAQLPAPWRRDITYVRLAEVGAVAVPGGPQVTPATDEHRPLLARWLLRALVHAAREQERPVDAAAAAVQAAGFLDAPSRLSLLVWQDGSPVGHATVLTQALDDITGEPHMELVDVLVEPHADGSACRRALLAAVADAARTAGLPLIGHVVHGTDGGGDRVTAALCARGWSVDHRYWRACAQELARMLKESQPT